MTINPSRGVLAEVGADGTEGVGLGKDRCHALAQTLRLHFHSRRRADS